MHTHLPSGSEAVLYTCQPSSEPGYSPCNTNKPRVNEVTAGKHVSRREAEQRKTHTHTKKKCCGFICLAGFVTAVCVEAQIHSVRLFFIISN